MQSSRIDSKAPWKQSVLKNAQSKSRVFNDSKEIFTKYSPTKDPNAKLTSKSLVRNKAHNYSTDEILLSPKNKDNSIAYQSNKQEYKRISKIITKQSKNISINNVDTQVFVHLKRQFSQFKEKILKQLSKQEQLIRKTIKEICQVLKKINPNIQNQITLSYFNMPQTKNFSKSFSVQPLRTRQPLKINLQPYRGQHLNANDAQYETILPQIKQKMTKLAQFIDNLKKETTHSLFQENMLSDVGILNGQYNK